MRSPVVGYLVAVVAVAAAVVLRWLFDPWLGDRIVFTTLYGAIAAAVWHSGYRPALLATALGLVTVDYFFIDPRESFAIAHGGDYLAIALYLFTSAIIIAFGEALRVARRQADQQRESLRVTLASIGDAVITTDTNSRITYLNAVAETLTGWTQRDAAGLPLDTIFRIVNEETRSTVENPVTRALREGLVVGLANHTVLITKNGAERPIDDSAAPIRDERGNIVGCILVFRDIANRRRSEEALRRSEERVRSVVNTVVDGIITINEQGTVESLNPAAEGLFGYSAAEVIGRNIKMLMPVPYRDEHDTYLSNYLQTGAAKIIGIGREVVGRRKDGSSFPMELAVSEFRLKDGRYFTGIVRDITERQRAEEALRHSQAELVEADRRKDEFLATLAHELRNPLAPIRNAIQVLLLKGPPDPELQWSREIIERQVRHMSRLLDDLLDVSRISYNKLELRKARIELAAVIESAVETSRPFIDSSGHQLELDLPPQPIYLDADLVRLSQVFSNLLNNAAKYTEPGGHIRLCAERQGSDVMVSVKDDGMGIAARLLPHIFDIFSQSERVLNRSQGGLGIGLSLVRGLLDLHGGRIEVRSDGHGKGSEFIVRLPVLVERTIQPTSPTTEDKQPAGMPKRRLLIADDLKDSADSLAMLLKLIGHEVRVAYDGEEAVLAAESFQPEVILLDIGMPKLNGYDACRSIREQSWGKNIFIVALTGWGQEDDRRRTAEAGFNSHLVKPVEIAALRKVLAEFRTTVA